MEDSLPHTASVLHVPAVLRVQLGVGLGGVTLREGFKVKIKRKCRNFHIEEVTFHVDGLWHLVKMFIRYVTK